MFGQSRQHTITNHSGSITIPQVRQMSCQARSPRSSRSAWPKGYDAGWDPDERKSSAHVLGWVCTKQILNDKPYIIACQDLDNHIVICSTRAKFRTTAGIFRTAAGQPPLMPFAPSVADLGVFRGFVASPFRGGGVDTHCLYVHVSQGGICTICMI